MYCENCGTGLSGQETVCPYCGITLRPIIPAYNPFPPPTVNQTAMPGNNTTPATPPATDPAIGADGATDEKTGGVTDEKTTDAVNATAPSDGQKAQGENGAPAPQQPQTGWQQRPLSPGEQWPNNPQAGFCTRCGQKLQPGQTKCAFCGQPVSAIPTAMPYAQRPYPYTQPYTYNPNRPAMPVYPPAYPPQPANKKPKGIVAGIVALCLLPIIFMFMELFPFLLFLFFLSLALGIVATVQGAQSHTAAGIVMGVIAIILSTIFCLIVIVTFIEIFSNPDDYYYEYYSYGKFFLQSLSTFFHR